MKYQQWDIAQRTEEVYTALQEQGVPELVASVLAARGISSVQEAQSLLSCREENLKDPFLMKDMDLAVARIRRALQAGEKIAVYGDYDVDGITATCVLTHYLRSIGGQVCYHINDRKTEGFGMSCNVIRRLVEDGVRLIVTVDVGITEFQPIEYAASLGTDVIVTDHHPCHAIPPEAVAVVDPLRLDCPYPFKELAGVGVALKLVMALADEKDRRTLFATYSDLAAIGTVADVMKLLGENRTIVSTGLRQLRNTRWRGLYRLMEEAGTLSRTLNATTVGYCLSPRLNAAGRMGSADTAVELILTEEPEMAEALTYQLCELNRTRQVVEQELYEECISRLGTQRNYDCIVLADKDWNQGVVGIVASRLSEQYACPVFIICIQKNGFGKGSCRSYRGFNLLAALDRCRDLLERCGGHPLAAGFIIKEENIEAFSRKMEEIVRSDTSGETMISTLEIDGEIPDTGVLTVEAVEKLNMLEPYGAGNRKPVFSLSGMTITCLADVGGGRHLKMRAGRDGCVMDMIFFSMTKAQLGLSVGDRADVAFYPQINDYRGSRSVQLHLVDVRPAAAEAADMQMYERLCRGEKLHPEEARTLLPQKADFESVWEYLSAQNGEIMDSIYGLARKISHNSGSRISPLRLMVALRVTEELGMLKFWNRNGKLRIRMYRRRRHGRINWGRSPLLRKLQSLCWESGASRA